MPPPHADARPEGRRCRGTSARPRGPARGGAVTGPADGPGGRRHGSGPGDTRAIALTRSRKAPRGPRHADPEGCGGVLPPPAQSLSVIEPKQAVVDGSGIGPCSPSPTCASTGGGPVLDEAAGWALAGALAAPPPTGGCSSCSPSRAQPDHRLRRAPPPRGPRRGRHRRRGAFRGPAGLAGYRALSESTERPGQTLARFTEQITAASAALTLATDAKRGRRHAPGLRLAAAQERLTVADISRALTRCSSTTRRCARGPSGPREQPRPELAAHTGDSSSAVDHQLHRAGLAHPDPRGWRGDPRTDAHRGDLADRLGVAGILTRRHQRHRAEREAWAWWCEELTWMRAPRPRPDLPHPAAPLRALPGPTLRQRYGPHPRRPNRRANFAAALATITAAAPRTDTAA